MSRPTVTVLSVIIVLLFVGLAASALACIIMCMRNRYRPNDQSKVSKEKFDDLEIRCRNAEQNTTRSKKELAALYTRCQNAKQDAANSKEELAALGIQFRNVEAEQYPIEYDASNDDRATYRAKYNREHCALLAAESEKNELKEKCESLSQKVQLSDGQLEYTVALKDELKEKCDTLSHNAEMFQTQLDMAVAVENKLCAERNELKETVSILEAENAELKQKSK